MVVQKRVENSVGNRGQSERILQILQAGGGIEDLTKANVLEYLARELGKNPSEIFGNPAVDALEVAMSILAHRK